MPIILAACATGDKPYLTERAFRRAAATCDVVSEGVHHSRGSKLPFANYRLRTGVAQGPDDGSHQCLAEALAHYRWDFFGEAMTTERE